MTSAVPFSAATTQGAKGVRHPQAATAALRLLDQSRTKRKSVGSATQHRTCSPWQRPMAASIVALRATMFSRSPSRSFLRPTLIMAWSMDHPCCRQVAISSTWSGSNTSALSCWKRNTTTVSGILQGHKCQPKGKEQYTGIILDMLYIFVSKHICRTLICIVSDRTRVPAFILRRCSASSPR